MRLEDRVEYLPIVERPPLRLPGGARLAVWIAPNVEYWVPDTGGPAIGRASPDQVPDIMNHAWREYGSRVGFWRLAEIFDRLGVAASVNLNADVCDHFPQLVRAAVERGWEILGHGRTNSQRLVGLGEEEERAVIVHTFERIREATGRAPAGWLGPGLAESHVTPDLLAETGFRYVCDWCDDDQPHEMRTRSGRRLLTVPYSVETNDYEVIVAFRQTGAAYAEILRDQFDCLYAEGVRSARVMCIPLHPFLSGQPHRAVHLERALRYMKRHDGVWWTTGGQIADWYAAQVPAAAGDGRSGG